MPWTFDGIGTSACGGRAYINWDRQPAGFKGAFKKLFSGPDRDSWECFVVFFLPLIPLKALHCFEWNGTHYKTIPIKASPALFAKVFLRRWIWVFAFVAIGFFGSLDTSFPVLVSLDALAVLLALYLLPWLDRRDIKIRRILGPHTYGSSDPATWTEEFLAGMRSPQDRYGFATFAAAARSALEKRKYSDAMWAARLCAALEESSEGERLTDLILGDPEVRRAVSKTGTSISRWKEFMDAG